MIPTQREKIMDLLKLRLEEIRMANGYRTNVGEHVLIWRVSPITESEIPCIIIQDTIVEPISEKSVSSMQVLDAGMNVDILCYTKGGSAVRELRDSLYDIYKAIGKDVSFDNNVIDVEILSDEITAEQEDRKIAVGKIALRIKFRTRKWEDE